MDTDDKKHEIQDRIQAVVMAGRQKFEPGEVVDWIQVPDHPVKVTVIREERPGSFLVRFPGPSRWFAGKVEVVLDAAAFKRRKVKKP